MISKENWKGYSKTFNDIVVEVGFGTSCILPKIAGENPETLFVGIEIATRYCTILQSRLIHGNIVVINSDIRLEIQSIPKNCISAYLFFFPSPPSSSRIFSPTFHNFLHRTLKKSGMIKIVTDDINYYNIIVRLFNDKLWYHTRWTPFFFVRKDIKWLVGTKCEKEYGAKYYLECYKK